MALALVVTGAFDFAFATVVLTLFDLAFVGALVSTYPIAAFLEGVIGFFLGLLFAGGLGLACLTSSWLVLSDSWIVTIPLVSTC